MKAFFRSIYFDLTTLPTWIFAAVTFSVVAIYGILLSSPVTSYDFNAAKGDFLQVFLTYFFMHRFVQAVVTGVFHDFTPFWTNSIGLAFLCFALYLLLVLFKRLGFCAWRSLIGVLLWLSAPFFFNRSIYQHAFPAETIAFCFDILTMLTYLEMRRSARPKRELFLLSVLLATLSASVYQAHLGLLFTGLMGVVLLDCKNSDKPFLREWLSIIAILGVTVVAWFVVNHGPMLVARAVGVAIPKSGGAHDTVFWFTGVHSFAVNVRSLFVGFFLNWCYNAFFVVGLRWVLLSFVFCFVLCVYWCIRRRWAYAAAVVGFALSSFALPVLQGSFANVRICFCLIPLVSFSGVLLFHVLNKRPVLPACICMIAIFGMGHETATLYYYNWKVKEHDKLHMSIVAHDLWAAYGLHIDKPVAIVGGWKHYPTCWEDLRPFRQLPLINHPFTTYSNLTSINVPREFYMVAREKIGLVAPMPDSDTYAKLKADASLLEEHPAYPKPGYIFEKDGIIIVNLGPHNSQWRQFKFSDYASPNEKLLENTLRLSKIDRWFFKATEPFRRLAAKYPWTVAIEPEGLAKGK